MEILFLLTQDLESPSGGGRFLPLAKGLAALGHKVTIAALHSSYDTLQKKRFSQDGVYVWYVGQMHVKKEGSQKMFYSPARLVWIAALATIKLSWAALTTPADIIHIGKPQPMNSIAGLAARLLRRKPVLLDCDDYEAASNLFSSEWQKKVVVRFEDFMPHHVDHVTTHNHFLMNRMISMGVQASRISYLPNGVDLERFSTPDNEQVEELRKRLGLEGKLVVGYIGSLHSPSHPLDLLIDAFIQVHKSIANCRLMIVGGGNTFDELKTKIQQLGLEPYTCFSGRVPPAEVSLYYRVADTVVDPVNDDDAGRGRMPLKMFESWALGVPFITCDVGDRKLVSGDEPASLLCLPGSPESIAEAIIKVLTQPQLSNDLRQRGFQRLPQYSWSNLAKIADQIYSQLSAV